MALLPTGTHRRRSGWTSGGRMASAEGWVRAKWGEVWGGVSPLQPTKGSGERHELPPSGVRGA